MKIPLFLKISLCTIGVALIAFGCYYAISQSKVVEEISQADVYEVIPDNPDWLLVIQQPETLFENKNICLKYTDLLGDDKLYSIVTKLATAQICQEDCLGKENLIWGSYNQGNVLFSPMNLHDFDYFEKQFINHELSGFAPKKENYKEATIYIKSADDENFFCYTHYQGIFIGSFQKKLIIKAIEAFENKKNINENTELNIRSHRFNNDVFAELFINNSQKKSVLNELMNQDSISWINSKLHINQDYMELSGILKENFTDSIDMTFDPVMISDAVNYIKLEKFTQEKMLSLNGFQLDDPILTRCIPNQISICRFTMNDSLQSNKDIVYFKPTCIYFSTWLYADKAYFVKPYNKYWIVGENKETVMSYIAQLKAQSIENKEHPLKSFFQKKDTTIISEVAWFKNVDNYQFLRYTEIKNNKLYYKLLGL